MCSIVTLQRTHKSWEKASMDVQQTFIFKICSLARKLFNLQYTICKNRFVDQSLFFWKSDVHFISECNPLTMEKNSTNISNFIFIQMKRWDESKNPFSPLFIRGQKTKNASLFCKKNNVLLLWRKEQSYAAKKKKLLLKSNHVSKKCSSYFLTCAVFRWSFVFIHNCSTQKIMCL